LRRTGSLVWGRTSPPFYTRVLGRVLGRASVLGITRAVAPWSRTSVVGRLRIGGLGCESLPGAQNDPRLQGSLAVDGTRTSHRLGQLRQPDSGFERRVLDRASWEKHPLFA
jgi:hypothetical protein